MTTPDDRNQPFDDETRALEDLLEPGSTLMVGTTSGGDSDWEFRPLTVAKVLAGEIDILLDTNEEWVRRFREGDAVHITLSDTRSNDWAHLYGTGSIRADESLIDELWSPFAGAYFEQGRETPGIAVMHLRVGRGRYWSAPSGRIGSLVSMVASAIGRETASGSHGDVTIAPPAS